MNTRELNGPNEWQKPSPVWHQVEHLSVSSRNVFYYNFKTGVQRDSQISLLGRYFGRENFSREKIGRSKRNSEKDCVSTGTDGIMEALLDEDTYIVS